MFFARNDRIGPRMIKTLKSPPYIIFSNSKKILNMEREGGKDFNLPLILGTTIKIYFTLIYLPLLSCNNQRIRNTHKHTYINLQNHRYISGT